MTAAALRELARIAEVMISDPLQRFGNKYLSVWCQCPIDVVELVVIVTKNGSRQYRPRCINCGFLHKSGGLPPMKSSPPIVLTTVPTISLGRPLTEASSATSSRRLWSSQYMRASLPIRPSISRRDVLDAKVKATGGFGPIFRPAAVVGAGYGVLPPLRGAAFGEVGVAGAGAVVVPIAAAGAGEVDDFDDLDLLLLLALAA